jgi:3-oxoacyl-[acyl-carrier protein] reductase
MTPRKAIVTGGSTGIGLEICRALLERDYDVISLSRRKAGLDSPKLRSMVVDLTDLEATRRAAAECAAQDAVTTIVHNAGAARERRVEDVTDEDLDVLTHLHLAAPLALLQANLPAMEAAHYGRIVLIASRAMLGLRKRTAYAATKAGMLGLARTWALELGGRGITVNVVAPGPIEDTEMFEALMPADRAKRDALARSIPAGRLGRPADVARAVCFFIDPAADFVTGQTLYVCGGASVGSLQL